MPDEVTAVALDTWPQRFDAACMFLALLAYPESTRKRDRAVRALRAWMFRTARVHGQHCDTDASRHALALPSRDMASVLRMMDKRIRHRLDGADVFKRLLLEGMTRAKAIQVPGPGSIRAYQRDWKVGPHYRPTWAYEVMHLAVALHSIEQGWFAPRVGADRIARRRRAGFNVGSLVVWSDEWIATAIRSAEFFARLRAVPLPDAIAAYARADLCRLVTSNSMPISLPQD